MSEPFELIDDEELALYLVVYEELLRQYRRINASPAVVLQDAFWSEMAGLMSAAVIPLLVDYGTSGALLSLSSFLEDEQLPEGLFDQVRTSIIQHGGDMITNITSTTRDAVIQLLDLSVEENWSLDQLTEALLNLPGSPFGEVRARLIAVTETTTAYIQGSALAAEELRNEGYNARLVWQTARDDIVCEICAPRQGRVQGDGWTEDRAAHPGCRCHTIIEAEKVG